MHQETDHYLIDDEGAGYLISISDMMSGLLFIFIITLVAFIINFQDAIQRQEVAIERQKKTRIAYANTVQQIVGAEAIRKNLLMEIERRLLTYGIQVKIDADHGVLRLTEKAIRFDTGAIALDDGQLDKLAIIGKTLAEILPCYAANPLEEWVESGLCSPKVRGKLDSVFVEGHTDNVPVNSTKWGKYQDNWELSALRAIYTYQKIVPVNLSLNTMINQAGEPIFSVSGYGEGRPIPGHAHQKPTSDVENRRIDLRFIMTPPSETEAEKALKDAGVK